MIVIAGPPGSGKSTAFPIVSFDVDYFNADDRAANLNDASYLGISPQIRSQVNREFETFIQRHIEDRQSLAFETTLRSPIFFEQALAAKAAGFVVEMRYLGLGSFGAHLQRVRARAFRGGHSAPETVLQSIYEASLNHFPRAIRELDLVRAYDNSRWAASPTLVLETRQGNIVYQSDSTPSWIKTALDAIHP